MVRKIAVLFSIAVGACGSEDTIRLTPKPVTAAVQPQAGRLVVVWFPGDGRPSPLVMIGYDAPFTPGRTSYEISLGSVRQPTDPYLACKRSCSGCPCSGPKIGLGMIVVVPDRNGDGKMDPDEFVTSTEAMFYYGDGWLGAGWVAVVYSDGSKGPDENFTGGVSPGIKAYPVVRRDVFGAPQSGNSFDLQLCQSGTRTCRLLKIPFDL